MQQRAVEELAGARHVRSGARYFVSGRQQFFTRAYRGFDSVRPQRGDDRNAEVPVEHRDGAFVRNKGVVDVPVVVEDGSASGQPSDDLDAVFAAISGVYFRLDALVAPDDDRRPVDIE